MQATLDPVSLVVDAIQCHFPSELTNAVYMARTLDDAKTEPIPTAMAVLFVTCARLQEAGVKTDPASFWNNNVAWVDIEPSESSERLRVSVHRMLVGGWRFDFCRPDITILQEFLQDPDLACALYWAAREFADVDDDARPVAPEVVRILGQALKLPDAA